MGIKVPKPIPQYEHRIPIQITRPPIRKPYTKSMGQTVVEGLAALTKAGASFLQNYEKAKVEAEITSAEVGTLNEINNFMLNLSKDPDYMTYEEKFEKELSKIRIKYYGGLKHKQSKDLYEKFVDKNAVSWRHTVAWDASHLGVEHMQVDYNNELNILEGIGDKQKIEVRYGVALDQGITTHGAVDSDRLERFYRIDYRTAEKNALNILQTEGKDSAIKYIHSDLIPESIVSGDIRKLENRVNAEWNLIQAEKTKELETLRTKVQGEIVQKYSTGNITELRKLRSQILNLEILPPVGQNSQLWWIDKIDTQIKTYLDAENKGETDPNTKFNPEIYAQALQIIYDDSIDLPDKEEFILNNMSADSAGNPRLRAKEDIPTLLKLARGEKSFTVKTAIKSFDLALSNEIITPQQYIDVSTEFNEAVESGKYTEQGLKDFAKNQLIHLNDEWIEDELEKTGGFFSRKEKPEAYIERHKPEERKVEKGLAEEFEDFFNRKVVNTYMYDDGREALFDGEDWWMLIDGKWHKSDQKTNTWKPYKRTRK